jgi:hypothetical protein
MIRVFALAAVLVCSQTSVFGWEMRVYPEFFRPAPFGGPIRVDWSGQKPSEFEPGTDGSIHLCVARNSYSSLHLGVLDSDGGEFTLEGWSDREEIEIDIFKEWFHRNKADGHYYPDALIPVKPGEKFHLPDPDMGIETQRLAAFWIDLWIPEDSVPGKTKVGFHLKSGQESRELTISLEILPTIVPNEDTIVADHNSYGVDWVSRYFSSRKRSVVAKGQEFEGSTPFFSAIHETHNLLYEHRGLLHDLGYGHAGTVNRLFAPVVEGEGKDRHIKSWELFDRHFGPLLDGSAFLDSRRGARPIEFLYLTINPEWPASYLDFGTDRYEIAFTNVVSEMEQHFRAKGWTRTNFEMFFNHKKRYKGFEWDGDETRFPKDNVYFKEYARLLHAAVPEDSPVSFVFRHDASWLFRQQMTELAGAVNFWVTGGSTLSLYPEAPGILKSRGDIVFIYGGSPSHFSSSAEILDMPVDTWIKGIDGFVRWLTTSPGKDPWFDSNGASTGMFFSGDRFGLDQVLPSIRLKIQRNCLQDIALLSRLEITMGAEEVRKKVAGMAGGATLEDWWNGETTMTEKPPWEWSNATYRKYAKPPVREVKKLDGRWWLAVRDYALHQNQSPSVPRETLHRRPTTPRAKAKPFRPEDFQIPDLPKRKIHGNTQDQMISLATICTRVLDGDRCRKIVTDRAEDLLFREVPGDRWAGMDNYDVELELFRSIKKDLIRLSQLTTIPTDCNLWLRVRSKPDRVHVVIRQARDWSQWYRFAQMTIEPTAEMKRALAGEQVIAADPESGLTSVLAPVKDSRNEVVGFVEICHGNEVVVVTQ